MSSDYVVSSSLDIFLHHSSKITEVLLLDSTLFRMSRMPDAIHLNSATMRSERELEVSERSRSCISSKELAQK